METIGTNQLLTYPLIRHITPILTDEEVIAEVAAPMIDEDGFETVTKRGRKKPSQR